VPVERSDRLPGRLRTGTSGPRYGGALPWRTLNVSRAILFRSAPQRATSEEWPKRQWCDRQIAGERSHLYICHVMQIMKIRPWKQEAYTGSSKKFHNCILQQILTNVLMYYLGQHSL